MERREASPGVRAAGRLPRIGAVGSLPLVVLAILGVLGIRWVGSREWASHLRTAQSVLGSGMENKSTGGLFDRRRSHRWHFTMPDRPTQRPRTPSMIPFMPFAPSVPELIGLSPGDSSAGAYVELEHEFGPGWFRTSAYVDIGRAEISAPALEEVWKTLRDAVGDLPWEIRHSGGVWSRSDPPHESVPTGA